MAFQVSPGVQVKEIDLTNVIPAVSSSIGGFVGNFGWGPADEITLVTSEKDMADKFSLPKATAAVDFFTAAYFLKYGNALKLVRSVTADAVNAYEATLAPATDPVVKNTDDYDQQTIAADVGTFLAKYPGELGNAIGIHVCGYSAADADFLAWAYKSQFTAPPGTSDFAAGRSGSQDEVHVVITDATGAITGTVGNIIETFGFLSQGVDAKTTQGATNYYVNVINNSSKYVWFANHDAAAVDAGSSVVGTAFTPLGSVLSYTLSGGVDSGAVDAAGVQTGFDLFEDVETVDVSLLFCPEVADLTGTVANDLIAIASFRKDCVAFVSPPISETVDSLNPLTDVIAWSDQLSSSSYGVIDSTALKVYDRYNDQYIWIPASSSVAGLCANTDNVADAWFSPAGYTRGQLLGVTKVAFNPKKAERDELYLARVNPILTQPGEGTVLFGDKTAQAKPSAFDRINVRRLFIVLEKAIATAAKYQLFEFNDAFTRAQFRGAVEPFLRDVQGRRGVTDFAVICDDTNNTAEVIDTNNFVADIYIKPARSINFITLNFIATRTGVEFSEIIGQ